MDHGLGGDLDIPSTGDRVRPGPAPTAAWQRMVIAGFCILLFGFAAVMGLLEVMGFDPWSR
jgi:hypothetical protein